MQNLLGPDFQSSRLEAPVTVRKCPTSHATSPKLFGASVLISAALFFSPQLALAQFTQQGPKLVGTFVPGDVPVEQGYSVALSMDGNTAIVGGPFSSDTGMYTVGAAWVFTRSSGVWAQQGGRLEGNDILVESRSPVLQGYSVALSADGNTAIVGGPGDGNQLIGTGIGASWVYTRSGGVWTQQGPKLLGSDAAGFAAQGWSVALSADGNTAVVGGPDDGSAPFPPGPGATWIYVRSAGVWTQQGPKLIGSGAIGAAQQGTAVAVSADGNTAIVSGPSDNAGAGAVWTFSRSGGVWTQQGDKLVVKANSVALSADGNTAVMGGSGTSSVYIRAGGVWTQQGPALVGTGAVGDSEQGYSVGITGDGNTAIVGGPGDNAGVGAVWLFTRNGVTWTQQGSKLVGTGAVGAASAGLVSCTVRRRHHRRDGRNRRRFGHRSGVGLRPAGTASLAGNRYRRFGHAGKDLRSLIVPISAELHNRQRELSNHRDSNLAERELHLRHGHHVAGHCDLFSDQPRPSAPGPLHVNDHLHQHEQRPRQYDAAGHAHRTCRE